MTSPSPTFYRVQDSSSFTLYSEDTGLNSNGKYFMRTDHIINAQRISTHLTWGARPSEPSPFISVFDNLDKAVERARFHVSKNRRNVSIMVIKPDTNGWKSAAFDLEFSLVGSNDIVDRIMEVKLPYWAAESKVAKTKPSSCQHQTYESIPPTLIQWPVTNMSGWLCTTYQAV